MVETWGVLITCSTVTSLKVTESGTSFRAAWQHNSEHTEKQKTQVLPDSSHLSLLSDYYYQKLVSGLQSGSGKWFLLKPVPKSRGFSPNTKIPQQRGGGLCHGSTDWVYSVSTHNIQNTVNAFCIHTDSHPYLGESQFFVGVYRPLQASCSTCSCREMSSQYNQNQTTDHC